MKNRFLYIAIIALLLSACSESEIDNGQQQGLMPVLFSAGNMDVAATRASAPYMPENSRFVCSMFFHAGADDTDATPFYKDAPTADVNMATRELEIDNKYGNAAYVTDKKFYWQNRKKHIFLALADNNKLDDTTLKLYPDVTTKVGDDYMLSYDLKRGDKTAMSQQPDPILAVEEMSPTGATSEANRVKLFFKHQFAQVQVNLKNAQDASASVAITGDCVESVELLGVAETGYVAYCINPDGTVPDATSEPINIDDPKYASTEQGNPYGSSFSMFARSTVGGYIKSFEGIAFGTLQGIRVTWKESTDENAVKHSAILNSVSNILLESGKKYIYNIELRRSSIAQVTPVITDWKDGTSYKGDGTIE